jgi:hypothetical protein
VLLQRRRAFEIGDYVQSGSEVLKCSGRGVWVRNGDRLE